MGNKVKKHTCKKGLFICAQHGLETEVECVNKAKCPECNEQEFLEQKKV